MSSKPATEQHLRELARLRRVRDRIGREYAQPLDVEALARDAHRSAAHFSRERGDVEFGGMKPTEQPYGIRDCSFRDPAGNLTRIQEVR